MTKDKSFDQETYITGNEIAIIGMSCHFPGAKNIDEFWELLKSGQSGIHKFEETETKSANNASENSFTHVPFYGLIDDPLGFDHEFFGISSHEADIMDPQHRLLLEHVWRALEHAGNTKVPMNNRIGLYAGVGFNSYLYDHLINVLSKDELNNLSVLFSNDKDFISSRIAYRLNFKGPCLTVQSACSTGLVCVHNACRSLLTGDSDMCIAGSASVRLDSNSGYFYQKGSIFSASGKCSAFSENADGCVPGNGVGVVVLKRLDDAVRDNNTIHSVILGSSVNNDGSDKIGYAAPSIEGQKAVILDALDFAEIKSNQVSYIETHGTGTKLGDPIEFQALSDVFNTSGKKDGMISSCAIGAVKTNIGHLDVASGIAGLIKTSLSLKNRLIPQNLNFTKLNSEISLNNTPFYISEKLTKWKTEGESRIAGVSSFGVGGTNAHVIMREHDGGKLRQIASSAKRLYCFPLTTFRESDLNNIVDLFINYIDRHAHVPIEDISFTLCHGWHHFDNRIIFIAESLPQLVQLLKKKATGSDVGEIHISDNVSSELVNEGMGINTLGNWVKSSLIDFPIIDQLTDVEGVFIPLFVSPIQKIKHFVNNKQKLQIEVSPNLSAEESNSLHNYSYKWERFDKKVSEFSEFSNSIDTMNVFIIFVDDDGFLSNGIKKESNTIIIEISRSDKYSWDENNLMANINPNNESDWVKIFDHLSEYLNKANVFVLYAWPLSTNTDISYSIMTCAHYPISLLSALIKSSPEEKLHITFLSFQRFIVAGNETINPYKAALSGPSKTIVQENSNISCLNIDLLEGDIKTNSTMLLRCLMYFVTKSYQGTAAIRGQYIWTQDLCSTVKPESGISMLKPGGHYLVTGGFGGIGYEICKHLAQNYNAKLSVLSRTGPKIIDSYPKFSYPGISEEAKWLKSQIVEVSSSLPLRLIHTNPKLVLDLKSLCTAAIISYFKECNIILIKGIKLSLDDIYRATQVGNNLKRLIKFMVKCLVEDGVLLLEGADDHTYRVQSTSRINSTSFYTKKILGYDESLKGLLDFFTHSIGHYNQAISGSIDSISVLYPNGKKDMIDAAANSMLNRSTGEIYTKLLARWIVKQAKLMPLRPIRLLEVGAGNCLLTTEIVRNILDEGLNNVEYWVTDIGSTFINKAKKLFEHESSISFNFKVFDISKPSDVQDIPKNFYDFVFGLNVVHATPNVTKTLNNLKHSLCDGAYFVLIESVLEERWVDMVAGLAEGWWYFDDDYRINSPLLSSEKWRDVMIGSGYEDPQIINSGSSGDDCGMIVSQKAQKNNCRKISNSKDQLWKLNEIGGEAESYIVDIANPEAISMCFQNIKKKHGKIDGVFHSAGEISGSLIQNLSCESIDKEFEARVYGITNIFSQLDSMPVTSQPDFCLLSSSLNCIFGGIGQAAYSAANSVIASMAYLDKSYEIKTACWDRWIDTGLANEFQKTFSAISSSSLMGGHSKSEGIQVLETILSSSGSEFIYSFDNLFERYNLEMGLLKFSMVNTNEHETKKNHKLNKRTAIADCIFTICQDKIGNDFNDLNIRLVDAGIDSILALEIQDDIERKTGLEVTSSALLTHTLEHIIVCCQNPYEHTDIVKVISQNLLETSDTSSI